MAQGVDYPRTHSVRALLEILEQVMPNSKRPVAKQVLEKYVLELGMLEDAYITSRYVMRDFTKQEAQMLTKTVKEIVEIVT